MSESPTITEAARRLRSALEAPAGRRPNPPADPAPDAPWRLLFRHAEGGPWVEVARAWTWEGAEEELRDGARGWSVRASAGDLVQIEGPEFFSGIHGVADDLSCRPLPDPRDFWTFEMGEDEDAADWLGRKTWPEAWETCPDGRWMLHAVAAVVDRPSLVRAAAACVAPALSYLPEGAGQQALGAALRWARGELAPERLAAYRAEAWALGVDLDRRAREARQERAPRSATSVARRAWGLEAQASAAYAAATLMDVIDPTTAVAQEQFDLDGEAVALHVSQGVLAAAAGAEGRARAMRSAAGSAFRRGYDDATARQAELVREALPLATVVRALVSGGR